VIKNTPEIIIERPAAQKRKSMPPVAKGTEVVDQLPDQQTKDSFSPLICAFIDCRQISCFSYTLGFSGGSFGITNPLQNTALN
jgi:hypothetical protein